MTRILIIALIACGAQPALAGSGFTMHRLEVADGVRALATDGDTVVVLTFEDVLIGVRRDGGRRFRVKLDHSSSVSVQLAVVADVVVVAASDFVLGVDAKTGKVRWHRKAADMDMLSTTIDNGQATIAGDAGTFTIDIPSGREVTPTTPSANHADDMTLHVNRGANRSELVAVDARTGKAQWRTKLHKGDALHSVFRGGGFFWVVVLDGHSGEEGDLVYRLLAVDEHGTILKEITAPLPEVKYCGGTVEFVAERGVLALSHSIKKRGECSLPVVDIYIPR